MSNIIFIDDDPSHMQPYKVELELRGHTVELIENADDALRQIPIRDFDLAIVDVMLGTGLRGSQFDEKETQGFKITGLILAERLILQRGIPPEKFTFFSMVSSIESKRLIEEYSENLSIPYMYKWQFTTTLDFGDHVEKLLQGAHSE